MICPLPVNEHPQCNPLLVANTPPEHVLLLLLVVLLLLLLLW